MSRRILKRIPKVILFGATLAWLLPNHSVGQSDSQPMQITLPPLETESPTTRAPEGKRHKPRNGQLADRTQSVAEASKAAKPSIVTIHAANRDGAERGLGTGFVIPGDLIVTNLHVTGEGRAFRVEDSQGKDIPISHVAAWDRVHDLVVLKPARQQTLPCLQLAPDDSLGVGHPIVVMGNPLGLKHSVVSGVLSGQRDVENRRMLQLAIPVEPGNSGGPVLDLAGRVHGIVTMKSLLTDNLGFAIRVAALRKLLDRQNPIPIEKWQRVGLVDASVWEPLEGSWRQRAATIHVEDVGKGFGGRTQCLLRQPPEQGPYDVSVRVKLDDEAGAAGLAFHADGKHRHYGFYPSGGQLRLTCFLGSSVYSWKVEFNEPSPHYRPGQWNHLRVRVEENLLSCFVNDHLVVRLKDPQLRSGRVGLVKFRTTKADFRHFRVAKDLSRRLTSEADEAKVAGAMAQLGPLAEVMPDDLADLTSSPALAARMLADRAAELERQAKELRQLKEEVRVRHTCGELLRLRTQASPTKPVDLAHVALLLASLDDPELDVSAYRQWLRQLGEQLAKRIGPNDDDAKKLEQLDAFMFIDNAFQGSHHEYYHRANSHLHRVLEDREGLPITLSVVYLALGTQIGLELEGVGLPGHFVVRRAGKQLTSAARQKSDGRQAGFEPLIDVFHGGKRLDRKAAEQLVQERAGLTLRAEHLVGVDTWGIAERMLRNLLGVAQRNDDKPGMLRYLEALVTLSPESPSDRGMRAVLRYEMGRKAGALADLDWILDKAPDGLDLNRVQQMRDQFERFDPQPR